MNKLPDWLGLAAASAVLAAGLILENLGLWWAVSFFAAAFVYAGWPVVKRAVLNAREGEWFDENALMTLASVAAWIVGSGAEAASVMVLYQWGEYLQDKAVDGSRHSLGALLASRPRWVRVGGEERAPEDVAAGTVFEVRAGEQVPLDAVVIEGRALLDTGPLTGESLPSSVGPGSEVWAGTVTQDALRLRSVRPFGESVWAGIVASVDRALERKAPLHRFITRFARGYTPAVLAAALVLFACLCVAGVNWHDSLYRSLVLLVIACPCALVVSVPLTYLGALGAASRRGVLIRDAGALDRLARVDAVAFDKTGTLTEGSHRVKALLPDAGEAELRAVLDAGFAASSHPLARSWFDGRSLPDLPPGASEVRGQGVTFAWKGERAGIGRREFLVAQGLPAPAAADATSVYAATKAASLGRVEFDDTAKPDTQQALLSLRDLGLGRPRLLSGDAEAVVARWGLEWDMEAHGGLLPDAKLEYVARQEEEGKNLLFVGDGLNDAPVLARASVGVSLGTGASAAAIEAADVAVLDGSPLQIPRLVKLGRRTKTLLYQNITLALATKGLFMVLGGLGVAGLWEAVFADAGVALLAVANSLRAGRALK